MTVLFFPVYLISAHLCYNEKTLKCTIAEVVCVKERYNVTNDY